MFCGEVILDYWWWVVTVTGEVSVSCVAVTSPAPPVSGARVLSGGQGCNTTAWRGRAPPVKTVRRPPPPRKRKNASVRSALAGKWLLWCVRVMCQSLTGNVNVVHLLIVTAVRAGLPILCQQTLGSTQHCTGPDPRHHTWDCYSSQEPLEAVRQALHRLSS